MKLLPSLILALYLSAPVSAQTEPDLETAAATQKDLETRARNIGRSLRCVVCQNQSIEESDASLAEDMRRLVRARIASGETDAGIIAFMQDRYGDFVLLKPPVQSNTYILWFAPFLLVGGGLAWFIAQRRTQNPASKTVPLSDDEQAALDRLS